MSEATIEKKTTDFPEKRSGCSLNYFDNSLYLFGGVTNNEFFDDLWKYNMKTKKKEYRKWNQINRLKRRCAHQSIIYKHYLVIFGGRNGSHYYNDLIVYNIKTNKWNIMNATNKPIKRARHGMILSNHLLIIYGGCHGKYILNDCYAININDYNLNLSNNNGKWIKYEIDVGYLHSFDMLYYQNKLSMYY